MASETQQQERREEVRRNVRGYLAERPGLAFHPRTIARSPFVNATLDEVEGALNVLVSLGHAEQRRDQLGSTPYYQAIGAGILAHERGE
jgi:hypothetical protein